MARTIKVIYEKGVFRPLVPVNLEEGEELDLDIPYEPGLVSDAEFEQALHEIQRDPTLSEEERAMLLEGIREEWSFARRPVREEK